MRLEGVGETLTWLDGTRMSDTLDEEIVRRSEESWLGCAGPAAEQAIARLGREGLRRVLRAPEVTRRLLFPSTAPNDPLAFMRQAVDVELALAGEGPPPRVSAWSALGDVVVHPDGTTTRWPQLDGEPALALDFGSPWATHIDLSGRLESTSAHRTGFGHGEVRAVHHKITRAMESIEALSPTVGMFVRRSTCVLVLQVDADAPDQVTSGTNGNYIGRSFITNPHHPDASIDCLVEAIVHEAIHGLLYRDSYGNAWVCSDAAAEVPRVTSPWTGRALPVRSFLEATFVWFGLVHLWALASRSEIFDYDAARQRIVRSVSGFTRGPLVDRVRPWTQEIRPDVLQAVDQLQGRVVDALVGGP
jgi:hypothetical protein